MMHKICLLVIFDIIKNIFYPIKIFKLLIKLEGFKIKKQNQVFACLK
jgi:hypothetical protein